MLAVRKLRKSFPRKQTGPVVALDGVDFSAGAGDCLCLAGPNGSGKTTLLKIISGLVIPDEGNILIGGRDISTLGDRLHSMVGYSPAADRSFYGQLSGLENLRFFASLHGLDSKIFRERIDRLDPILNLRDALISTYQSASSGMRQRLSLARALLHNPSILLLDEATRSLDPESASRLAAHVNNDFFKENPDRLVVWTTQSPEEAWSLGTSILILDGGRKAALGTPEELQRSSGADSPLKTYRAWLQGRAIQ